MKFSVKKSFIEGTHEDRRILISRAGQRLVVLLAITAIVLGIYYFRGDIANWYRETQSRQQLENIQGTTTYSRVVFEPDSDNIYALYGINLTVINKGNFKIYSPDGTELLSLQLSYSRPALCASGEFMIAYDRGGTKLTIVKGTSLIKTIDISGEIISVESNNNGYFTVAHGDSRYRSVVSVYDSNQNLIYEWKTPDYYVIRASVAPDNKTIAVTAYTQKSGVFISRIFFFNLSKEEYFANADLEGTIITNTYYLDSSTVCLVGDDKTVVMDTNGKIRYQYEYGNDMIKTGASSDGYVALTMLDRTSGLGSKMVVFSTGSDTVISAGTKDEIRKMSACGDYIAVLYTQSIQMFDKNLKPLSGEVSVSQVRDILVNSEGISLLIYASDAGYVDLLSAFKDKDVNNGNTEG